MNRDYLPLPLRYR
jgi:hypothetical protein